MRRLPIAAGFLVVGVIALAASRDAGASHVIYLTHLYHPTGDSSNLASLNCGWHESCDGNPSEPDTALDWDYNSGSSTYTWLRFKTWGGGSAPELAAQATSNFFGPPTCARIVTLVKRFNGQLIGSVLNLHSYRGGTTALLNLQSTSSGYITQGIIGNMYTSHPPDSCLWTGMHTHQYYVNGTVGINPTRNTSMPTEATCYQCNQTYATFQVNTWEYKFQHVH